MKYVFIALVLLTIAVLTFVSLPTDAPFLPRDLVSRLVAALEEDDADLASVESGGRRHPVVGLWPVRLADDLRRALVDEDVRKIDVWTARYKLAVASFGTDPVDPFFNANRPEDLAEAEGLLLPKPGGEGGPLDRRPIWLLSTLNRLWAAGRARLFAR